MSKVDVKSLAQLGKKSKLFSHWLSLLVLSNKSMPQSELLPITMANPS
jgi:hypothetical protein